MARDYKSTEAVLGLLREAAYTFPELRIGQIIENACGDTGGPFRGPDVFMVEDDRLVEILRSYIDRHGRG